MRAPIAGIRGATGLLQRELLSDAQRALVDQIENSAEVLSQLVNDTLDLARLQSGRVALNPGLVDLSALADEVVAQLVGARAESTLDVVVHYPGDSFRHVRVDGLRLRQVLTNLVGNAVKFTRQGQVDVTIFGRNAGVDHAKLTFSVRDTGIGIAADRLDAIFEPFEQANSQISTGFGGTGLGLPIARGLVTAMGGELVVQSVEGQGTCFEFSLLLPIVMTEELLAARARRISQNRKAPRSRRHGMAEASKRWKQTLQSATLARALVADDDQIGRLVARAGLVGLGLGTQLACDGQEAVAMAHAGTYELALIDLHMPKLDGYEVLRQLRALPRPPVLIALTAADAADVRQLAQQAGADEVLTKPFEPEDLARLLDGLQPAWWRRDVVRVGGRPARFRP